jgi:hypothetical protein
LLVPLLVAALAPTASAIVTPTFGPNGTYARPLGAPSGFLIGSGGTVEELDAFVAISGQDLNGADFGSAAQLSVDPVPAGLGLTFSSTLLDAGATLLLRYDFTNQGAAAVAGLTFLSFLDAEIDETTNTFFNEYATTAGALAPGQGHEADEPGYAFGDIFDHLLAGALDGTNAVGIGAPDDVSMALSFLIASLAPGQTARFDLFVSENGTATGFRIDQMDVDPASATAITFSGTASVIPEPGTAALLGLGLTVLASRARRLEQRA